MDLIKLKYFVLQRTLSRKWKDNPHNGKKYLQILCLMRIYYPEHIKNAYKHSTQKKTQLKTRQGT